MLQDFLKFKSLGDGEDVVVVLDFLGMGRKFVHLSSFLGFHIINLE